MAYCGEQSAVKHEINGYTAVSLKCRAWTCPDCADKRKSQLIAEVTGGAPSIFLTLTSRRRKSLTANAAALEISRAWRLVRLRLMRHLKLKKLPFITVMEATANGWPHLHICLRSRFLPVSLIRKWMDEIMQSPVVHIKKIDNPGRVARYVAPYCSKAAHKFGTAKRYWQTRDYDLRQDQPGKPTFAPGWGWQIEFTELGRIVHRWHQLGWRIEWQAAHKARAIIEDPPPW